MLKRIGRTVAVVAASLGLGCSGASSMNCSDAGTMHDETIMVSRGDMNGVDFDMCASGNCAALCSDLRGRPGDGTRTNIVMCDRVSIDLIDGGSQSQDVDGGKDDAQGPTATALSVHVVYEAFSCRPDTSSGG
jgi:hypothetical protein